MFRIGDFSKFSRVSVKMLRHYDQLGLLKPARVDPVTNYRYYSADQLPRLNRIIALKDLGFTLEQISRLLDDDLSAEQIKGMLKLKQAEIEQQVQTEQLKLARVEVRLMQIELEAKFPAYEVVLRKIEPQLVASIRRVIPNVGNDIVAMFETLEAYVAQYEARAVIPPLTMYHDTEYREDEIEVEVAVPLTSTIPNSEVITIYALPGIESAACVVHTGDYATINQAHSALFGSIEANGYQITGPMREVYLRFSADNVGYNLPASYLATETEAYVTELQIPVEKV